MHPKELRPEKDRDAKGHWHIMSPSSCFILLGKSVFVDSGKPHLLIYCCAQPWCHPSTTRLHRAKPASPAHHHLGLPAKHSLSGGAPCPLGLGQPKTIPLQGNTISTNAMHCMVNAEEQPGLLLTDLN